VGDDGDVSNILALLHRFIVPRGFSWLRGFVDLPSLFRHLCGQQR
jgi:hypothetical protein